MKNKKGSHVGFVIAFVIFVAFILKIVNLFSLTYICVATFSIQPAALGLGAIGGLGLLNLLCLFEERASLSST